MIRSLLLLLLAVSSTADAVVIRDDVDDAKYRISASEFPALVDMPGEGHGVLIAPQWVITAAHTIPEQWELKQVVINGAPRKVERVLIHPGYKKPSHELVHQAMATWDWTMFMVQLSSSDDVALLKLAQPVTDASPVVIHEGDDQLGQIVRIIGKGATGNGATGYDFADSRRTELRRAHNKVTSAHGRWFCYVFDKPAETLPLEGGSGGGDSGGPVLIQSEKDWLLAGLTSWTAPQGVVKTSPGLYGQISCNVRLRHYKEWIESTVSAQP